MSGSVRLSGGRSSSLSVVLLSLPSLAGGAAWLPPSFGRAAFLPLLWVGVVPRKMKKHRPKGRGGESTTTRMRRRKAAPPKGGGGDQTAPPNRREVKSSPTQRMGRRWCFFLVFSFEFLVLTGAKNEKLNSKNADPKFQNHTFDTF